MTNIVNIADHPRFVSGKPSGSRSVTQGTARSSKGLTNNVNIVDGSPNSCNHLCLGPHYPIHIGGVKIRCHNPCSACKKNIKYGYINEHIRECHSEASKNN